MGISLWSSESVPIKVWNVPIRKSLWVSWECPYQFDLSESDLIKPYQNEWNRWDLNELKWIERLEVKWVIWRIWLCEPYGNGPMVGWRCPYQSDLNEPYEKVPIKMNGIDEKWVNRVKWGEMSDLMDLTWMNPMEKCLWVGWECPYGSDLSESENQCPYQNEWNRWEMNELKWIEVNRGEMSDLKDLTWNNPMEKSLWSIEGVPIKVTWVKVKMKVPIKMNGIDEKWMNWSE